MENNNKEALKLLNMSDTNSESEIPEFTLPPKTRRKVRVKKKPRAGLGANGRNGHHFKLPTLWQSIATAAWLLLAGWLGTLFWYSLNLQAQVQRLSQDLKMQEARNQNMPEAMHEYHGMLQDLQKNHTIIFGHILSFTTQFDALGKQLAILERELENLQDRLKASPELVQLPKDLQAVQNSVASFGSKISDLESTTQSLRSQQENSQVSILEINGNITALKNAVNQIKHVSQDTQSTTSAQVYEAKNAAIWSNLTRLGSNLDSVNKTLSGNLQWAEDDLHKHHALILKLQDTSQNLSARISTIETAHGAWESLLLAVNSTAEQLASQSKKLVVLQGRLDNIQKDVSDLHNEEAVLREEFKEYKEQRGSSVVNPSTRQPLEHSSSRQSVAVPEPVTDPSSAKSQSSAATTPDKEEPRT